MNVEELKDKLKHLIPSKEVSEKVQVVVARKKKRSGYDIHPCVTGVGLSFVSLPGMVGDAVAAIVFED